MVRVSTGESLIRWRPRVCAARRVLDEGLLVEPVDCDTDVGFTADGVGLQGHLHLPDPSAAVVKVES